MDGDGSCIIYGCNFFQITLIRIHSANLIGDGSCDINSVDIYGCTDST